MTFTDLPYFKFGRNDVTIILNLQQSMDAKPVYLFLSKNVTVDYNVMKEVWQNIFFSSN